MRPSRGWGWGNDDHGGEHRSFYRWRYDTRQEEAKVLLMIEVPIRTETNETGHRANDTNSTGKIQNAKSQCGECGY